jgi:hypothetical protein
MPEEAAVDFWPDISASKPRTPLSLMKQQAALLGKHTNNLLEAEVETTSSGDKLFHRFIIVAPSLDYRYQLFGVTHGVTLYPVQVLSAPPSGTIVPIGGIEDEGMFVNWLKAVLSSEETKRILGSLLAQAES